MHLNNGEIISSSDGKYSGNTAFHSVLVFSFAAASWKGQAECAHNCNRSNVLQFELPFTVLHFMSFCTCGLGLLIIVCVH